MTGAAGDGTANKGAKRGVRVGGDGAGHPGPVWRGETKEAPIGLAQVELGVPAVQKSTSIPSRALIGA
jgi:hypothetical protein